MWAALSCDSIQLQDSWRLNWFHLTSRTLLTCHHITLWGGSLYQYLPNTMSTIFDHLWTYSLCLSSNVSLLIKHLGSQFHHGISSTLRCPVGTPHHVWHAWTQRLPKQTKFHLFMPRSHTVDHIKKDHHSRALHGMCRQYIHWFRPNIHHLQQGDDSMTQSPSRLDEAFVARAPHHACAGGLWNSTFTNGHTCVVHAEIMQHNALHGLMILPLSIAFW